MKNRVQIKTEAKSFIRTGRVSPLIVTAIVIVIETVLSEVLSLLQTGDFSYVQIMYELGLKARPEIMYTSNATFFMILFNLLISVMTAGYYDYLLGLRKGWEMPYSSLLNGLSIAGKVIGCQLLTGLKVFLWSLLFFIPGIIASYRYRFALYNIIENPNLTVNEAIALSCQQTEGWKMELFILDWSFFFWHLLTVLTGGIAGVWVRPYVYLSDMGYYEMICKPTASDPQSDNRQDPGRNDTPWEF